MNLQGLTSSEVQSRISEGLINKSQAGKSKTIREIFIENIFSVFNFIIGFVMAAILFFYFRTGNTDLVLDSLGVLTIGVVNTAIAIFQEIRAKKALDKVSLLLKKSVIVIRDGKEQEVEQNEIVKDDLIKIGRGDQIPVDGVVVSSNKMEIDESLLTGESHPIHKKDGDEILSGSFCISGNGYYRAEKVGGESYAAQVTDLAKKFKFSITPLQKKINFIVKMLFTIALVLVALEIIFARPSTFDDVPFIRKMATILISLIPQGLVLMVSVSYAIGIYRISKIGAIIQRLNAIESFSNIKIVCMDKTGTLTQNKLAVEKVSCMNESIKSDINDIAASYAYFSSDKNATAMAIEGIGNHRQWVVKDEMPFSSENKYSAIKVDTGDGSKTYILGAYDVLAKQLKENDNEAGEKLFNDSGLEVYRNLLLGEVENDIKLDDSEDFLSKVSIKPYCIISISDQAREDVMDAINLFRQNGIEFKILTGDAAFAVKAIVNKIGWDVGNDSFVTGSELEEMNEEQFEAAVMSKLIFARLKPEHKLRIIQTLKRRHYYTAMLGDGVNDLPAIKEADMGIAMEEGSQITKEVADIVLLENKFSLLPEIFDEGKKIVNTVASMAKLFLTKNFLVIYLTLFSLLFLLEFPLTPRRVAFINIFIIGLPAFTIALKNTNTDRNKNFLPELFSFVSISALLIVLASYATMFIAKSVFAEIAEAEVQMMMLVTMITVSIASFYAVTLLEKQKSKMFYFLYGLFILGIFLFLAFTEIDFVIFTWIKAFYEIINMPLNYWGLTLAISIAGALILFFAQVLRKNLINKYIH